MPELMTKVAVSASPAIALKLVEPKDKAPVPGSVTRADLCEAVHREIGLSRNESSALVEQVLDEICATLVAGSNVKVSSFGSFVLRNKGQRIGRNPKTGQEVPIEPRTVLTFRPSQLLRERINREG